MGFEICFQKFGRVSTYIRGTEGYCQTDGSKSNCSSPNFEQGSDNLSCVKFTALRLSCKLQLIISFLKTAAVLKMKMKIESMEHGTNHVEYTITRRIAQVNPYHLLIFIPIRVEYQIRLFFFSKAFTFAKFWNKYFSSASHRSCLN